MKRSLLLLSVFYWGLFCAFAQGKDKVMQEQKKDVLFQQSVDAIKDNRFIIKFHAEDFASKKRVILNGNVNFLIVDGKNVSWQSADDRNLDFRETNIYSGGGSKGLVSIKMNEAELSEFEMKTKKNGDVIYRISVDGRMLKEAYITLKKRTNDCMVKCKFRYGDSSYFVGTLYPIDATTVERGTPYR